VIKLSNKFLITAFVTSGTPYEEVLHTYLLPSIQKFNLEYNIEVVENKGSWLRNVAQKPKIIKEVLDKYPTYQIVCLDADSEIKRVPDLFNQIPLEYDLACHYLDWNSWYGYQDSPPVFELLSGTLWINNTEQTRFVLHKWEEIASHSDIWEQKVLSQVLTSNPSVNVYKLPVEYCYISSLPNGNPPLNPSEFPVIVHHQVSRKLKKRIKKD